MYTHGLSRILDHVAQQPHGEVLHLPDGATVEFLTHPNGRPEFCVMRGVIPPGGIVPLHSHDDPEAFFVVSGTKQALLEGDAGLEWHRVNAGDYVDIKGGTRHAWRNDSDEPVVDLLITTNRLGQFFEELRRPAGASGPPSPDDLTRLAAVSAKYGYWFATPEENADMGIDLPSPGAEGAGDDNAADLGMLRH